MGLPLIEVINGCRKIAMIRLTNTRGFCLQAMLYAAGVPNKHMMKNAPHVGIATVWWEGNPCK